MLGHRVIVDFDRFERFNDVIEFHHIIWIIEWFLYVKHVALRGSQIDLVLTLRRQTAYLRLRCCLTNGLVLFVVLVG